MCAEAVQNKFANIQDVEANIREAHKPAFRSIAKKWLEIARWRRKQYAALVPVLRQQLKSVCETCNTRTNLRLKPSLPIPSLVDKYQKEHYHKGPFKESHWIKYFLAHERLSSLCPPCMHETLEVKLLSKTSENLLKMWIMVARFNLKAALKNQATRVSEDSEEEKLKIAVKDHPIIISHSTKMLLQLWVDFIKNKKSNIAAPLKPLRGIKPSKQVKSKFMEMKDTGVKFDMDVEAHSYEKNLDQVEARNKAKRANAKFKAANAFNHF